MFSQLDSVSLALAKENNSIKKIDILLEASKTYSNSELSLQFSKQAYSLAIKTDDKISLAKAADQLSIELYKAELFDSIPYYQEIAITNFKLRNNVDGLFKVLLKKAKFFKKINKPEKAFNVYKELIDLAEKSESTLMLAEVYENMGLLFSSIKDIEKSISYFSKSLKLYSKIKDWKGISKSYLNLGNSNSSKGYTDLAIECFERGLVIDAKYNNNEKKAEFLSGIGTIYFNLLNNEKALYFYKEALKVQEVVKPNDVVFFNINIAVVLMDLERYKEAKPYLIEAYYSSDNARTKADYAFNLAQMFEHLDDYKSAIDFMDTYVRLNDSLNNAIYTKNLSETEAKYQNEKREEQNILLSERLKNKSLQIYFALAAILLLVGLAFFIFRGLRQKNKANIALSDKNKIIEEKSLLVEEQHKDITDSIKYAQRIQQAILPPDKLWNNILPQSFVFYQPKDILSGDFYWIEETTEHIFIAAADCTGHGVPGALMSIVNYNLLNRAVLEHGLTNAGAILDSVNKYLTLSLHQTYQESAVRDGMDVSLCVINKKTKKMDFAGAFNSIYLIRNNAIQEFIPDKQPVGAFIEDNIKLFTSQSFQLLENDVVYMFTDGYAYQFGGPKGKKYKYKQLQHLLLSSYTKPFDEQNQIFKSAINDWKGSLEQVDDILLLGYKII